MPPAARTPLIDEIELTERSGSVPVPDYDPGGVPDGARRLLLGPVDSFEKLSLIVALRRVADAPQDLDSLEASTGAPTTVLSRALDELISVGLVAHRAGRWALAPDCDRTAIDELVEAWASNRNTVLNLITQRSIERIRTSVARTFADAFRLRRGGKSEQGEGDG